MYHNLMTCPNHLYCRDMEGLAITLLLKVPRCTWIHMVRDKCTQTNAHPYAHIYTHTHNAHKHIDTQLHAHWQDTDLHAHVQVETHACSHTIIHTDTDVYMNSLAHTHLHAPGTGHIAHFNKV